HDAGYRNSGEFRYAGESVPARFQRPGHWKARVTVAVTKIDTSRPIVASLTPKAIRDASRSELWRVPLRRKVGDDQSTFTISTTGRSFVDCPALISRNGSCSGTSSP